LVTLTMILSSKTFANGFNESSLSTKTPYTKSSIKQKMFSLFVIVTSSGIIVLWKICNISFIFFFSLHLFVAFFSRISNKNGNCALYFWSFVTPQLTLSKTQTQNKHFFVTSLLVMSINKCLIARVRSLKWWAQSRFCDIKVIMWSSTTFYFQVVIKGPNKLIWCKCSYNVYVQPCWSVNACKQMNWSEDVMKQHYCNYNQVLLWVQIQLVQLSFKIITN